MQFIAIDGVAWSVGLSVCNDCKPRKNGWTDRDAVWDVNSGGLKELCIRCGPDSQGKGHFWKGWRRDFQHAVDQRSHSSSVTLNFSNEKSCCDAALVKFLSIQSNPHGPALTHLKWPAARHSCSKRAFKQKCLQLSFERTVVRYRLFAAV